ncbi:MAG: phosphatase PAP2 family protein [Chloroflexi bacterium]|nr:phosphatase PAP2 family protein [Chloroflexota bacterium]
MEQQAPGGPAPALGEAAGRSRRRAALEFGRELVVVLAAVAAYFLVRGLTEGSRDDALRNARWLLDFERATWTAWEDEGQDLIVGHSSMVTLFNWVYMYGHWPVIAVAGAWLYLRRPHTFFLLRNACLISGTIGIVVFATFPVAPPRLLDSEFVDTVTLHSRAYRVLQPPAFVNQYAAMPSLHFGWNLLVGWALVREGRYWPVRLFGWVLPVLMALAIVLTANHFVIDGIAGAAVALAGLAVAILLRRIALPPRISPWFWGDPEIPPARVAA